MSRLLRFRRLLIYGIVACCCGGAGILILKLVFLSGFAISVGVAGDGAGWNIMPLHIAIAEVIWFAHCDNSGLGVEVKWNAWR